jgi:tetratricopeptide (TPR) repeat protein
MRRLLALLTLLLLAPMTTAGSALAEQPQAQLDSLMAKLRDPATGSEVLRIEPMIWDLWMHGGTNAQNEQLAKATAAMNIGDGPGALRMLDGLLAEAPDFAEAWNKRATLLFMLGRYDDSLTDIIKVLDLEPRHFGALSGRGMILQRQGKNAEALAAFKEALNINPKMVGARLAVQQLEKLAPEL